MKCFSVMMIVAAVLASLASPARGVEPKRGAGTSMSAGSGTMHEHMRKAGREMQQMRMTGDIDHDFVTAMRKHHQNGIKMAEMVLASGKNPRTRELAQRIIEEQQRDLRDFDAWLAANDSAARGADRATGAGDVARDPAESPSAGTTSKGSEHRGASKKKATRAAGASPQAGESPSAGTTSKGSEHRGAGGEGGGAAAPKPGESPSAGTSAKGSEHGGASAK